MAEQATEATNIGTTPATAGVVLIAFGKPQYYEAAYNLAFSIKKHSPTMPVTLLLDDASRAKMYVGNIDEYIDSLVAIEGHIFKGENGKIDPCKVKLHLYDHLPYDHTIYLDVDAIALKDLWPLMDELKGSGKHYAAHTVGYHTIDEGKAIPSMQWGWADDIWERYGLKQDTVLPAINSSLQYIERCGDSKMLFDTAKSIYLNNATPLNKLRNKWGGGQPDELYMNIALAIHGIDPAPKPIRHSVEAEDGYIHFAMRRGYTFEQVVERYYLQSYYGGAGFTARFYTEWIDRLLTSWMREAGKRHNYYIDRIQRAKHANNK